MGEQSKKVLMVYCYAAATQGKLRNVGGAHPPIGLLYAAAAVEREGHQVRVSDELVNDNTEQMIDEFKPDVLCLSVNTPCVPRAKALVEYGRAHGVSTFIAGGAHAVNEPQSCVSDVGVDAAVMNEGEIVLPDLVNKKDWSKIKGITYKDKKGKITNNGKRELIEDLDAIAFPARHLIDFSKYAGTAELGFFLHKNEKWTPVITSRGCPYLCTFCANWRVMGRNTRDRSPENVVAELKEIKNKYGINAVVFLDDTFTLRPERVKKICELMLQENLDMKWSCQTRVNVSKELLELMKKAGCQLVAFGVESGSNKVLNIVKKGTNIDQVKQAFKISREVGLRRKAYFVVGLPGEEKEDFEMSVRLAKEISPEYLWVSKFAPVPGSEYYEKNKENLKDMKWEDYGYFNGKNTEEVEQRHRQLVRSYYLRPTYMVNFLKRFSWVECAYMFKMFKSFMGMGGGHEEA
jgi:radical SAM superfamily enzyme YgiQ (UPF0313 family)